VKKSILQKCHNNNKDTAHVREEFTGHNLTRFPYRGTLVTNVTYANISHISSEIGDVVNRERVSGLNI
jgi:hypothetical protein